MQQPRRLLLVVLGDPREPYLLPVQPGLQPAQHGVVDPALVAQPDDCVALVGQQRNPELLLGLVVLSEVVVRRLIRSAVLPGLVELLQPLPNASATRRATRSAPTHRPAATPRSAPGSRTVWC